MGPPRTESDGERNSSKWATAEGSLIGRQSKAGVGEQRTLSRSTADGSGVKLKAEGVHYLENGSEIRRAIAGKCLVEALTRETCVTSNLRHALRARDVSERLRDKGGITARFLEARFKICRHLLGSSEMLGDIVAGGDRLAHSGLLRKSRGKSMSCLDVLRLRALVASNQQNDDGEATLYEVHAIARAVVDPEFGNAPTDRANIARVAVGKPSDSGLNASSGAEIAECVEPDGELVRFANLEHGPSVAAGLHAVNSSHSDRKYADLQVHRS